jgi:AraC-like DNA-binding protein
MVRHLNENPLPLAVMPEFQLPHVEFRAASYAQPFSFSVPAGARTTCYFVLQGQLHVHTDENPPQSFVVGAGSVLGVSALLRHCVSHRPVGRRGTPLRLLVASTPRESLQFLNVFGNSVTLLDQADDPHTAEQISRLLALVEDELSNSHGSRDSQALLRRYAEAIVLQLSRYMLKRALPASDTATRAMGDQRLLKAIGAYSRDPARAWSVQELATIAGMSRTSFANRFQQVLGETPIRALTRLRLRHAAAHLLRGNHSVIAVARAAGYDSEASFIRAFSREYGSPPARWRGEQRKLGETLALQDAGGDAAG